MRKQPAHTSSLPPLSAQTPLWLQGGLHPGEGFILGRASSWAGFNSGGLHAAVLLFSMADFLRGSRFTYPSNNSLLTHIIVTINNKNITCSYYQITASNCNSHEITALFSNLYSNSLYFPHLTRNYGASLGVKCHFKCKLCKNAADA